MKFRKKSDGIRIDVNMTAMIDIIFLLLIFFMVTFKIAVQEGDFSVRMPLASNSSSAMEDVDLPLKLRLKADVNGRLTSIALNEVQLGTDFDALRSTVIGLIGNAQPGQGSEGGPEVEIDTDYNLRYENIIKAITAVSGYKVGTETVKLIEKIKFAKPRR